MSSPLITDSAIFKRLVLSTKGRVNTAQLTKTGMTMADVCNFIGDSLVHKIAHYVPILAINDPTQFLVTNRTGRKNGDVAESPATLLAALLAMEFEQISDNAVITSFSLDSLGAGAQAGGGDVCQATGDGPGKYGEPLVPIFNDRLVYDERYTTDASPTNIAFDWFRYACATVLSYSILNALTQREYDDSRDRAVSKIDPDMSHYVATQWDTHEGAPDTSSLLWKLEQTIYPAVDLRARPIDLVGGLDAVARAYETSLAYDHPGQHVIQSASPQLAAALQGYLHNLLRLRLRDVPSRNGHTDAREGNNVSGGQRAGSLCSALSPWTPSTCLTTSSPLGIPALVAPSSTTASRRLCVARRVFSSPTSSNISTSEIHSFSEDSDSANKDDKRKRIVAHKATAPQKQETPDQVIAEEERNMGAVGAATWWAYLKETGGATPVIMLFLKII
ncbi:hypothetical protein BU15DRAFT_78125 [Melanogaster broomeanus]|nr:hypothetical protein BU15DRAFT_78125 [Melanogaster broomeanus]